MSNVYGNVGEYGLMPAFNIKKKQFIIEYVGELYPDEALETL
jgi:SET domain-containing protein